VREGEGEGEGEGEVLNPRSKEVIPLLPKMKLVIDAKRWVFKI
jgi:hypothetical protein